jgi:NADH pyrophosphatase NudC (nudix superfamily)
MRELVEEIGLKITGLHLLTPVLHSQACPETSNEFVWVYRLNSEGPFVLNPAEIERGGWFTPAEVTRAIAEKPEEYARSFRYIWTKMIAQ